MSTTTLHFHRTADGRYGLSIHPSIPFKPWSAINIFSEVFERYFIEKHHYFTETHAINMASEIAAMGHRYYYLHSLQPFFFKQLPEEELNAYANEMIKLPQYLTEKFIAENEISYCTRYYTGIAYQATNTVIDPFLKEHWRGLRSLIQGYASRRMIKKNGGIGFAGTKLSIKKGEIQRPYRWGYQQAFKMVRNTDHNREALNVFYRDFEKIAQLNLEELAQHYSSLEFTVKHGNAVEWKARFISHDGVAITHKHFCKPTQVRKVLHAA